jgi:hypothetical protein
MSRGFYCCTDTGCDHCEGTGIPIERLPLAERVHQERCELLHKIIRLQEFIESNHEELDGEHQFLLEYQLRTMQSYEVVLLRRWTLLKDGV